MSELSMFFLEVLFLCFLIILIIFIYKNVTSKKKSKVVPMIKKDLPKGKTIFSSTKKHRVSTQRNNLKNMVDILSKNNEDVRHGNKNV